MGLVQISCRVMNQSGLFTPERSHPAERFYSVVQEQDKLHHNMVLPELDTGATHDHIAPAADTMQSVATFENAPALNRSRGDEKHSESPEQAHVASIRGSCDLQGLRTVSADPKEEEGEAQKQLSVMAMKGKQEEEVVKPLNNAGIGNVPDVDCLKIDEDFLPG
jgi:hypothetical protein